MRTVEHMVWLGLFVLVQTVFFPAIPLFDPMLVLVLHLAISGGRYEGVCFVILAGMTMDGMSGVPVGTYLMAYLWLFGAVRLFQGVLKATSPLFILLALLAGVVLENGFTLFSLLFAGQGIGGDGLGTLPYELLSAALVGSPLYFFMHGVHERFVRRQAMLLPDTQSEGEG